MVETTRRTTLKALASAAVVGSVGTGGAGAHRPEKGRIRKLGHSLLSDPVGEFAEEDIRADGQYGVVGSFFGEGGSFLVDLSNPTRPEEVHRIPSSADTRNADVAFDPRDGLYYRSQEPNNENGEGGVEVVDYGYDRGTLEEPVVAARMASGHTHNVFPHPTEPVLYAVNEAPGGPGIDVWDVADPATPRFVGERGPVGGLHDVVVDPERDLAHCAYIFADEAGFAGYAILDVSDPTEPTTVGTFDYDAAPDYTAVGEEGFELCHYADYDPDRMLAYVGDEKGSGLPGGKHVFDIGWGDGSLADPRPVGFTTSPNAERMDGEFEGYDWTTHNHDVVSKGSNTTLVSGDYHEGVVVYDVADPTDPVPTDQYRTDDDADDASELVFPLGSAPMAWGANYSAERDLVFTSDMVTGVYTFKVTPSRGN